ncbi:CBS domain-containing protein [Kitasatospora sp. NPDC057904]|uniref:CBS domain-containing protein n=1 Tax=unclassified Kitasatospora TaxID=2633591 RepID=UPI0036DE2E30
MKDRGKRSNQEIMRDLLVANRPDIDQKVVDELSRAMAENADVGAPSERQIDDLRERFPSRGTAPTEAHRQDSDREATAPRGRSMTARDIMHSRSACIAETATLSEAAEMMAEKGVSALPVCDSSGRLQAIITERDIIIKCVALGKDPSTMTTAEAAGAAHAVHADDQIEMVLRRMEQYQIRRVPVIDNGKLVGMISEADLAVAHRGGSRLTDAQILDFMASVYVRP